MKRWIAAVLLTVYWLGAAFLYKCGPQLRDALSPSVICAYAEAVIVIDQMAYQVPRQAVILEPDGSCVFYVAELDDAYPERAFCAVQRQCVPIAISPSVVYVPYAVLDDGAKVIVVGAENVQDGCRVVIQE